MNVTMSPYLQQVKPLTQKLVNRLKEKYAYVSLLGTDCIGKKYTMKKTGVSLDDSDWGERGFVVRVHNGKNYSEYAFNELSEDNLDSVIAKIDSTATAMNALMTTAGFEVKDYAVLEEEAMAQSFLSEAECSVLAQQISHEEVLGSLRTIMEETLAKSDELVDVRVIFEEYQVSKMFLSGEKDLAQSYIWANAYVVPIGIRDGKMKYSHTVVSGLKGAELIEELKAASEESVNHLTMLLGSEPIEPGEYDIILDPEMSGLVAHEAFGHGVEMDMFVKNRAKAKDFIDKEVAAPKVDMYDGAKSAEEVSSYLFDDEGVLGSDTKIIDGGVLKSGISDVLSALTLGTKPTGNGKRQSYEHKVYSRMTNTFFGGGTDKVDDMIASIDHGYLLESYSSGMEDPKNWGIQCVVSRAREIKEGRLTGKVFSPVFLTGYVPDLLKSMTMVSEDVHLTGGGYCGKGHKEYVKTSTGGPFIKAKGRLN